MNANNGINFIYYTNCVNDEWQTNGYEYIIQNLVLGPIILKQILYSY